MMTILIDTTSFPQLLFSLNLCIKNSVNALFFQILVKSAYQTDRPHWHNIFTNYLVNSTYLFQKIATSFLIAICDFGEITEKLKIAKCYLYCRQQTNVKGKREVGVTKPVTKEITLTESLDNKLCYLVTSQQNWYLCSDLYYKVALYVSLNVEIGMFG